MWPSLKPSQREAIVGVISPQSATTVQTSAWVPVAQFQNFEALVQIGAITGSGTVDAKIQQATDSSGTSAKDITGKAITQVVGSANSNVQVRINVKQDDLDVNNAFTYIRLSITPAVAAALIGGLLQGVDTRYGPADGYAAASQVQVVG